MQRGLVFKPGGAGLCDTSCQNLPAGTGLMRVAVAGWGQRGSGHIKGDRNPPLMGCTRCSLRKLTFVTPPFSSAVCPRTPMTLTSYKPRYKHFPSTLLCYPSARGRRGSPTEFFVMNIKLQQNMVTTFDPQPFSTMATVTSPKPHHCV